jgi:hypothetical protein
MAQKASTGLPLLGSQIGRIEEFYRHVETEIFTD